jgi:hypothetical protein
MHKAGVSLLLHYFQKRNRPNEVIIICESGPIKLVDLWAHAPLPVIPFDFRVPFQGFYQSIRNPDQLRVGHLHLPQMFRYHKLEVIFLLVFPNQCIKRRIAVNYLEKVQH